MKTTALTALLLTAAQITSCTLTDISDSDTEIFLVEDTHKTQIENNETAWDFDEQFTETLQYEEAAEANTGSDTDLKLPDRDFTELDGDLSFYRFDNGNAAAVWNNKNVWVFDFELEKITPVFDHESALAAIDFRGEGAKYFDDFTLTLEFSENADYELRMSYTVMSTTDDARYTAYSYYTLNSFWGTTRGDVRGYFAESISYPGSDEAVTITDVADREKLFVAEDNYLFDRVAALVTQDTAALEGSLSLSDGTLESWKNVKISDYTITREDFSEEFAPSLYGTMNITESDVYNLPAGNYSFEVYDGPGPGITLTSLDRNEEPRELSDAEAWLEPWVTNHAGQHHTDDENIDTEKLSFHLVCFYLRRCYLENKAESYDDFLLFCSEVFGIEDIWKYVRREDVENHGGHGGTSILSEIVSCETDGDKHVITVNYFAEPMEP